MAEEARRLQVTETAPCCGACAHWHHVNRSPSGAVGECMHEDNAYYVEASDAYKGPIVLDLALCSKWEAQEGER